MSQNIEKVPFRTAIRIAVSNFLQKNRTALLLIVGGVFILVVGLAIWTQIDASTKIAFAAKIEKSQLDLNSWQDETDIEKKKVLGAALELELSEIQKTAPLGYGLSKAWFLQGIYYAEQMKWSEASQAFYTVFEKDHNSYLSPIALTNAAVSKEESGEIEKALNIYSEFEKYYSSNPVLAPQVFFAQGRILEMSKEIDKAVLAYKKLLDKFPESSWTKLGRDRVIFLTPE